MSLQRNKENDQPTAKQVTPFSREKLKRDAQRQHEKPKHASTSQVQEKTAIPAQKQTAAIPELEKIEVWAAELTEELQEDTDNAKANERVMLMTTSVIKMCRLLKNFSEVMTVEMEKHAERELQNLNIQKQYAESVKASTVEVTRDIYYQFQNEQKQAFDNVAKYLSDTNDEMEKSIYACTAAVKKATKSAVCSAERLRKVKTFGDLMYYAAPIFVLADIILRFIDIFLTWN